MQITLDIDDLETWLNRNPGKTKDDYVAEVREWSGQLWELLGIGDDTEMITDESVLETYEHGQQQGVAPTVGGLDE